MLESGLTYLGPNPSRISSPLAGLPSIMDDARRVVFDTDRRAAITPARVRRAGQIAPTPDLVGGRSHSQTSYDWPAFRETASVRGMDSRDGLTERDGVGLMQRIARGIEVMLVDAFTTGAITYDDGEVIDVWGGASPEFTPDAAWTAQGGDPLGDILSVADAQVSHGARPSKRLLLSSDAYRALVRSADVREMLDVRNIDAGKITLEKAPGIMPIATPSDLASAPRAGLDALTQFTYDADLGSFSKIGTLAGIDIYRDCVGLLGSGEGIMLSRAGLSGGGIDADQHLIFGYPRVCGQMLQAPQAEIALYRSVSPDGMMLDSYCLAALAVSNPWGAIHLKNLV